MESNFFNRIVKVVLILFSIFFLFSIFSTSSYKADLYKDEQNQRVVLLLLNRVSYEDLINNDVFYNIMKRSSIGLMTIRTSGKSTIFKAYSTIGSGTRAEASRITAVGYNANQDIRDIFYRRMGTWVEYGNVVNTEINRLILENLKGEFGAVPGNLGHIIRTNGKKTAVLGNMDIDAIELRPAVLIAMDKYGIIDYGDVDKDVIIKDPLYPYGIRTDYTYLLEQIDNLLGKAHLITVELGDMYRLEAYRDNLNPQLYLKYKNKIIEDAAKLAQGIMTREDDFNTSLIILSPFYSIDGGKDGNRLVPVIYFNSQQTPGLMISDTTQRKGIIGNIDIAPTILEEFGLSEYQMTGRPIRNITQENNIAFINSLNNAVTNTYNMRPMIVRFFAFFQIVASFFALGVLVFFKKLGKRYRNVARDIVLGAMLMPLVLLLSSLTYISNVFYMIIYMVISMIFLLSLLKFILKEEDRILACLGLVILPIIVDIVLGGYLNKTSILGFDPIVGARFYGMGNEFAGILIGAIIVFTALVLQKTSLNKFFALFLFIPVLIILAHPNLGANVGATITATVSFGLFILFTLRQSISYKSIVIVGLICIIMISLMAVVDLIFTERNTHFANFIHDIRLNGFTAVFNVFIRKITMNLRLIRVTIWSRVLLSFIGVLTVLFFRPLGVFKQVISKYKYINAAGIGVVAASVTGFVVNDSGIVMAATSMIFLTMTMMHYMIDHVSSTMKQKEENEERRTA